MDNITLTTEKNYWIKSGSPQQLAQDIAAVCMSSDINPVMFQGCLAKVPQDSSLVFGKNMPPVDLMMSVLDSHQATVLCGTHKALENKLNQHCIVFSLYGPEELGSSSSALSEMADRILKNWTVIDSGKIVKPEECERRAITKASTSFGADKPLPTQRAEALPPPPAKKQQKPKKATPSGKMSVDDEKAVGSGPLQAHEDISITSDYKTIVSLSKERVPLYLHGSIDNTEDFRNKILACMNFYVQRILPGQLEGAKKAPAADGNWRQLGVRNRFLRFIGCGHIDNTVRKLGITRQMMVLAMFDSCMNLRPRIIYDDILKDMQEKPNVYLIKNANNGFYDHDAAQRAVQEFISMSYSMFTGVN